LLKEAETVGFEFEVIHVHIGSGGKKEDWLRNVKNELSFARKYFKNLKKIDFGGGLKVARVPQ
jgi:diaminopimelate decarboxylase